MNIDAIEERPGDPSGVAFDLIGGAGAVFFGIMAVAARTGIHGGNEHDLCGKGASSCGSGNRDFSVFEWLAEDFEGLSGEFG